MTRLLFSLTLILIGVVTTTAAEPTKSEPAQKTVPIPPIVAQPPGTPFPAGLPQPERVMNPPVYVQKTAPAKAPILDAEQTAREEAFAKLMSGATLEGQFTARDRADGKLANDKYTLGKVSKVAGSVDTWNFETRIEYGGKDFTLPIAVRVVWSGDTPVITLDKLAIPGAGTFTARVMIFNNQYAGMWDGSGNHGGLMFGKVTAKEEKK